MPEPMDSNPGRRNAAARIVADHWRNAALEWGDTPMPGRLAAHPLAMVEAALDGETDPVQLGIPPHHPDAAELRGC